MWLAMLLILAGTFFGSLFGGRYFISPGEVGKILIAGLLGGEQDSIAASVVWNLRPLWGHRSLRSYLKHRKALGNDT
ncbi:MAG: hypothetical protein JL57_16400 [Desulfosporosinus sp. BICA1-9]|nr:MAG: hypothetical protein JL57_16400 [Desulfosporosinus sp. BICA1-9]